MIRVNLVVGGSASDGTDKLSTSQNDLEVVEKVLTLTQICHWNMLFVKTNAYGTCTLHWYLTFQPFSRPRRTVRTT